MQRQNSDRVVISSMETERRGMSQVSAITVSPGGERPRCRLSINQRSDSSQMSGKSIGIVSFKEVARVQSAVLEASPQLDRKERVPDVQEEKLSKAEGELNLKETSLKGPQTPKSLRRTTKVENLASKNERSADRPRLWFEYGQV